MDERELRIRTSSIRIYDVDDANKEKERERKRTLK